MTEATAIIHWTTCPDCQHRFDAALVPGGICPRCMLAGGEDVDDDDDAIAPGIKAWQPPSVADLQPMLPDYELIELIGRGGMGAVYRARQPTLDRLVAIKVLPAETAEREAGFVERFKNEARLLARMNHPGIVHVYDFGTLVDGSCYFVMEHVDGTDVARMVAASGKLPPEHAASITADVCAALHYAHEADIVHRDIKPGNILVTRHGQVKVADFGLAKQHDHALSQMTQTGMTLGTPEFVAPESLLTGMVVDHRADLYAVGVMLYNMLTGQIPRGVFKPVSSAVAVSPAFDGIIQKAMQADPEHRYQTAQALQTDVQSVLQAKPESKVGTEPQSKPGGKPGRWIAVFAGVLGLIAAAVFYPSASPPAAPSSKAKEESGGDILVEDEKGAALPVTITAQNFGAGLDASVELQDVKNVVSGFGFHLALKKDGTLFVWGNNKNVEISLPVGLTDVIAIGAGSYATHALAVRADGSVVAWGTNTQGQCDVPPGLTDVVAVSGGRMHSLALKKDGSVVTWGGRGFDFVSAPSGLSDIIAISAGGLFNVALKKDGSVVAWGLNRVGQTDVPEGARSGVISISAGSEHVLALKKDGSVIAWGHNSLGQATVPTEATSDVIAIASGTLHSLALKRDGSVIAWGGKDTSIPTPTDFRARAITAAGIQSLSIIQRAAPLVLQGSGTVKTLKIKNRGNEKLTTATPTLYGTDASDFALDTSSLSNQIDANGSQNLSITFRPTTTGAKSAFLRIPSDDPDTPHYDIPLTGSASNP